MSLAWVPILESALRHLASNQGVFVAPRSRCMITEGPDIARFEDGSELDAKHYLVKAILYNQYSQTCDEKAFILPSVTPGQDFEDYSISLDNDTGILHVASRFRYVTLDELALLRKPLTSANDKEIVPEQSQSMTGNKGTTVRDSTLPAVVVKLPPKGQLCKGNTTPCNKKLNKNISAIGRNPLHLTIDPSATTQRDSTNSVPQTGSSTSEGRNGTIYTAPSSATSLQFSSWPGSPVSTDHVEDLRTGAGFSSHENASGPSSSEVTRSAVHQMQFFAVDRANSSPCCEALDLVIKTHESFLHEPTDYLDLAPPVLKISAYAVEKRFASASQGSPNVEIALDDESGELYLQAVPSNIQTQSSLAMLEVDAMFDDDDDDLDSESIIPTVDLPIATPSSTCMTVTNTPAQNNLGLRQALSEDTIHVLAEVNMYYRQIWQEHQRERGVSQPSFDQATYDKAIQDEAVARFESYHTDMPRDALRLIEPFIRAFLHRWCAGTPGGLPKPDGNGRKAGESWISGVEEPIVNNIAVRMVEWEQIIAASQQTRLVKLRPGVALAAEKPLLSSFDWFLQALGGDEQYREHRCSEVKKQIDTRAEQKERPIHHYNFNRLPVYKRSYTPPEVSFWAAATTYNKQLVERLRVPLKDGTIPSQPLPAIHVTRIRTAEAFKWVDPTLPTGIDIRVLWEKKGSAMRNAATSNVDTVYEPIGTWTEDRYSADDHVPRVAPSYGNYEHAGNGNYNFPQLPCLVNDYSDEHLVVNLNVGKQSKRHFHQYQTQYGACERQSFLRYELGAELIKKAALLEAKLEKKKPRQQAITSMNTLEEEGSDCSVDGDEASEDLLIFPDVPTVSQGEFETGPAPLDSPHMDADIHTEKDLPQPAIDIQGAPDFALDQSFPKAIDIDSAVALPEDGRYLSPSKMDPSRIGLDRTPPQSPSKADDLGSWEIDEDGAFVSPCKSDSSVGSLATVEDGNEDNSPQGEDNIDPFHNNLAQSPPKSGLEIIRYPSELHVFGVQGTNQPLITENVAHEDSAAQAPEEIDVAAEMMKGWALISQSRADRLRLRPLTTSINDDTLPEAAEENESFDGENGITDHNSTLVKRHRVTHAQAGFLARFIDEEEPPAARHSPTSNESKAAHLAKFSDKAANDSTPPGSILGHEETRLEKLAKYSLCPRRVLAGKCESSNGTPSSRSASVVIKNGEVIVPSPDMIVGECKADFDDQTIQDVLAVPCLDAESNVSSDSAIIEDLTEALLPPVGDESSEDLSSDSESSNQQEDTARKLSPIREESEAEMSPITLRKQPRAAIPLLLPTTSVSHNAHVPRILNMNPNVSDDDFHEALLEKLAQIEAKRSGMNVTYDAETDEETDQVQTNCAAPKGEEKISEDSSEETTPTWFGNETCNASGELTPETSTSSPDAEGGSVKATSNDKPNEAKASGKLNIDEISPERMPPVHCYRHMSTEVNSMPKESMAPSNTIVLKAAPQPAIQDVAQSGTRYGAIALAVGSFAIELANWVFWRCMW